jgi:hypothetical protein
MVTKRKKAVTKEDFTQKPTDVEVWTDSDFKEYVKYVQTVYNVGDDFAKNHQWKCLNDMIDDVLSGKIFVNPT